MTAVAILSVFAGMLLGLRLRVVALVPAALLSGIAAFAVFVISGESVAYALSAAVVTVIAIQIGYLCATFAASLKDAPAREAVAPVLVQSANAAKPVTISDR